MYNLIRRIHLFTAFFLLSYITMYFVTGLPLTHESWFPRQEPSKSTRVLPIEFPGEAGSEALAAYLETALELRGKRERPRRQNDGSWRFAWFRPGTQHEVIVARDEKNASLTTSQFGSRDILVGLHRLHGYGGGWLYNLWAGLMDLASVALIVFAISGVYLWHQSTKNRLPGSLCLGAGLLITAGTIFHLMTHP